MYLLPANNKNVIYNKVSYVIAACVKANLFSMEKRTKTERSFKNKTL